MQDHLAQTPYTKPVCALVAELCASQLFSSQGGHQLSPESYSDRPAAYTSAQTSTAPVAKTLTCPLTGKYSAYHGLLRRCITLSAVSILVKQQLAKIGLFHSP